MADALALGVLAACAFLPPLAFAIWVRNHERHAREPLFWVLTLFGYGGTVGIFLAILFSLVFQVGFQAPVADLGLGRAFFATVVVAPFTEELSKGLGLRIARPRLRELEDGIVYGAAIGFGFAATENFIYGYDALVTEGQALALETIAVRVISSTLLHSGSCALLGFGYGLVKLRRGVVFELIPYYLVAVAMHALYNGLVTFRTGLGFLVAVAFVVVVATILRRRIRTLDHRGRPGKWHAVATLRDGDPPGP